MATGAHPSQEPNHRDDARLGALLERWFALRATGQTPDLEQLCAEAPELLPRMRRLLERDDQLLAGGGTAPRPNRVLAKSVGGYRLLARIGSGASSEVFLARQESLARHVALKILRPDVVADDVRRLRFQREAEITAALEHPNIAPVYEIGEDGPHAFLAMRLIPGRTLADLAGSLAPRKAAALIAQIARGLHAAHEIGVVHRDVKPANVMVDGDLAFIVDFGLARASADLSLTHSGQAPGTLPYMAPEQLRGGATALDPRVDVYGLGATLYHCLSGTPPFPGETSLTLIRSIMTREPKRLTGVARDLETVVRRALDKEPPHRFATALAMAEDLERFVRGEPIHSRPAGPWLRLRKRIRRHPAMSLVVSIASIVVIALALIVWMQAEAKSRDRAIGIEAVEQRLAAGRSNQAFLALTDLRARHGADAELDELRHRVVSTQARDALLDQLQALPRSQDLAWLEELARELDGAHAAVLRQPATRAAKALLAAYRRDRTSTTSLLADEELGRRYPRFVAALGAVNTDRDPVDALADVTDLSADVDDHVLTATVIRMREMAASAATEELERAWARDRFHTRTRYGMAVAYANHGQPDRAEALLDNREDGRRPDGLILLAGCAIRRGRPDVARDRLAEARALLAQLQRPPGPKLLRAELFLALVEHDFDRFDRRMEAATERWGDIAQLRVLAGQAASLRARPAAARAEFERARELAVHASVRREADAALLQADAGDLFDGVRPADATFVADLLDRARRLSKEAHAANDGRIESYALVVERDLLDAGGDAEGAAALLEAAMRAYPDNPNALHLFVTGTYQDVRESRDGGLGDAELLALGRASQRALDACERVLVRAAADVTYVAPRQQIEMLLCGAGLAMHGDDPGRARRMVRRARQIVDATEDEAKRPEVEAFEAQLARRSLRPK